jgi:hypothetical protein
MTMHQTDNAKPAPEVDTPRRRALLRALTVMAGTVVGLALAALVLFFHVRQARSKRRDVAPGVRRLALEAGVGIDENYMRLMQALTRNRDEYFAALDTFRGAAMSKDLFVPTDMYGARRYRFRSDIAVHDVSIWTGLAHQTLQIPATPQTTPLLDACKVRHRMRFETDANGFKKTPDNATDGAPVVFFLGDSYTEGLHVASEDTFVARFGRKLASDGLPVRPFNLGVGGYGTMEECWLLEHFAPLLKPAAVILNMYPNDVMRDATAVVRGTGVPEERYRHVFKYLTRIAEHCRQSGIALVVAAIPSPRQVGPLREFSCFQDRVGAWCREHSLPFLDPHDTFAAATSVLYIPWDGHLSVTGHALYADFLHREAAPLLAEALGGATKGSNRETQ